VLGDHGTAWPVGGGLLSVVPDEVVPPLPPDEVVPEEVVPDDEVPDDEVAIGTGGLLGRFAASTTGVSVAEPPSAEKICPNSPGVWTTPEQ
jgi:hypothetical protein